jgi:folylpolyglutamate synthase
MGAKMDNAKILPPHEFLYEDASHCNPADNNFSCSAVMPSLPLTIKWLRDCVKENPSVRVQVRLLSEMATSSFFNLKLKWL